MPKKLTTEIFINRAHILHRYKYDYSKVTYKNSKTKIEIICPIHGIFIQVPDSHLCGKGCIKCGGRDKSTKKSFIMRATEVHGYKYDYSKVTYKNSKTKIEIICPKHGVFRQTPVHHLNGKGCRYCVPDKLSMLFRSTKGDFVNRAIIKHGDKYDYSLVEYRNAHKKIKIVCPKHGVFVQEPNSHIQGNGCPRCAYSNSSRVEKIWLQTLNIESLEYGFIIKNKDRTFVVDGYDPTTNTIYEYLGSFWHGNPDKYDPDDINPKNKKRFGDLYEDTMERINILEQDGYNVIYKWGK